MHVGDRIRLKSGNSACETLGISREQIGLVVSVDVGGMRAAVLIHFPEADIYTSALEDSGVDILSSESGPHRVPEVDKG